MCARKAKNKKKWEVERSRVKSKVNRGGGCLFLTARPFLGCFQIGDVWFSVGNGRAMMMIIIAIRIVRRCVTWERETVFFADDYETQFWENFVICVGLAFKCSVVVFRWSKEFQWLKRETCSESKAFLALDFGLFIAWQCQKLIRSEPYKLIVISVQFDCFWDNDTIQF